MPVTKAQIKAVTKYTKKNYDTVVVRVPKGEKAKLQEAAAKQGYKSFNSFAKAAFEEKLNRK